MDVREHVGDALTPVRWAVVQSCGLLVNLGLVYLFVARRGLDKLVGQAFATAIVVVGTFVANRAWTFRMHPATLGESVSGGEAVARRVLSAARSRYYDARQPRAAL